MYSYYLSSTLRVIMVEYVVSGRSGCIDFAKCEYLACYLHKNLPSFAAMIYRVHEPHWLTYIEGIAKRYKFSRVLRTGPCIYTTHGKLIGGADEFYTLVRIRACTAPCRTSSYTQVLICCIVIIYRFRIDMA